MFRSCAPATMKVWVISGDDKKHRIIINKIINILIIRLSIPSFAGVGKTTLARKLSLELRYKLFLEPTVENPYLEKFYAEPNKYALPLQLWILRQRYQTYLEAAKHIIDTGEYTTYIDTYT